MPKIDSIDIVQGRIEKGRQVVFLLAGRDCRNDLIEIKVGEEVGRADRCIGGAGRDVAKKNASNSHRPITAACGEFVEPAKGGIERDPTTAWHQVGMRPEAA